MKTFTKHILLLALMLFGVAGAAWATRAPQKWTTQVAIADLVQGDTLMEGFSITCSGGETLNFHGNRLKVNNSLRGNNLGISCNEVNAYVTYGPNASLIYSAVSITPVDANGQDGNAWLVTSVAGSSVYIDGIYVAPAPDPTVPALDELTGNWNFLMPGANKVVKVTYKAEPALAWTYGNRAIPNDTTITAYRGFELPVIGSIGAIMNHDFYTALQGGTVSLRYGSTNPAVISFTNPNNMYSFSVNGAGECDVYMVFDGNDDFQDDSVAFHAVIANPATLTLNPSAGGTLEIAESVDTVYNITLEQSGISGDSRSFTIPASRFPYDTTFSYNANISFAYAYDQMGGSVDIFARGDNWITVRISGPFQYGGYYSCELEGGATDDWSISCTAGTGPVPPDGVIAGTAENTYLVLPGTEVNVTATPDTAHYLSAIGNEAVISNSAYNYSFTMPDDNTELAATFTTKPTLTLAQTEGGTLEAIVPQGGATDGNDLLGTFTGGSTTIDGIATLNPNGAEYDEQTGWGIYTNNTDMTVTIAEGVNVTKVKFIGDFGSYYEDTEAPYQVTLYQYYDGFTNSAGGESVASIEVYGVPAAPSPNVIASSTPNTYIIDYGTPVTVVATPDAQHYLVRFSDDDPATELNSNLAVEKTYDSVIAPIDLSANFQAKPTLTLTANDGGTLTLDGMTDPSPATAQLSVPGSWAEDFNHVSPTNMPTDFQAVDENVARAWQNTTGKEVYLIFAEDDGEVVCYNFYEDGSYDESSFKPFRASIYELVGDGGLALYTTGAIGGMPAGVVSANATRDTFVVDYNTDVTVVATPDATHYLATLGEELVNSNDSIHRTFTMTAPVNLPADFRAKPTLTLTANDGGTLTLDGMTEPGATGTTFTVPGTWQDDNTPLTATDFPGFVPVSQEQALNWQAPASGNYRLFYKYEGGYWYYINFNNGTLGISNYEDLYHFNIYNIQNIGRTIAYTTGAIGGMPAGVVSANATRDTFVVDYGTELTVTATPDSIHYLATLGGVTMGSNTAKDTTFAVTATTNLAANFAQKPTLTLAHNDGGEMEVMPAGGVTAMHLTTDQIPTWPEVFESVREADLQPFGFVAVDSAAAAAWTGAPASGQVILVYAPAGDQFKAILFQNGQWYDAYTANFFKGEIYTNSDVVYFTTGVTPSNVIATAEPNTYYIDYNTSVTVKATPDATHYLVRFDNDAALNSNVAVEKTYQNITADVTSEALFAPKPTLTLAANDTTWGKVTIPIGLVATDPTPAPTPTAVANPVITGVLMPDGSMQVTMSCTTQDADIYYTTDNVTSPLCDCPAAPEYTDPITFTEPVTIKAAAYTGNDWSAVVTKTITLSLPAGVAKLTDTTYCVDYGASVTVQAIPDTAHYLVRFDNDADTNSNVAVEKTYQNITADVTSEALFAPKPKLTLAKTRTMEATDDWGSVSFNPLQYPWLGTSQNTGPLFLTDEPDVYVVDYGATVTVTADATELHHVANWVDADSAAYPADRITYSAYFVTEPVALFPDSSTLTLTVTADTTAKAVFGINSYDVFATAQLDDRDEIGTGTAMGYLNVSYKDIVGTTQTAGPEDTLDYTAQGGSLSTITSTSYYGYRFSGWYDADMDTLMSSVNPLTLTEAAVVEARYTPINYTITGLSEDDEMGTVTGGGTLPYRTPVSLTAVPERGYHFTGWDNGLSANPLELAAMSDFTVTASFAPNQYTVTVLSGDETMGSASGSTVADFHTTVTLTATPNAHYHFVAWSNGVTDTVTELLVDGDTTVTALFAADEYTITGLSADSTMGSVSGSATVTYPATVTLTATAANCHHFVQWNDGVTANPRTVNALEDLTLTATFAASTYASSEDVTTCDNYTWNNVTYTASGIYTYNTTTLAGCDSTATLHLTLITGIETEEVVEACESYEWHGVVYTQSTGILGAPTYTTTALNGCDSTVTLRLTINHGTTAVETVEACDSYTWNGRTYFSSTTTATYTTEGSNGCDSTTTLHLTLGRSTSGELNVEACESYTWHGVTYTESIVGPTDTNLNTSGCPHVTTLHLTILRNSSSEETVEACDVYNWHGVNRYASGDYVFLSPNAVGCDSTAILHLTIRRSTYAEEIAAACDEYEWHGILFTESADTTLHTLNAAGCDSAMTLHLTLYYNSEATDVVTACDSYTWIDGVTYTASTDEPTYTLSGANCSTTVTLNLTVNYSTAGIDEQEAVDSYTWINGITYTASTDQPTFVLTNAAGCDSVVTLHLTITYTPEPVYYNVTLATADATMGSVAPAGTTVIEEGLSFTATATALTGRHFVAWVSNGTVVSNANPYTFVVNDDVELTATFDYDEVIAVLTVNDETMGTTTPAPGTYTFHVGDEATVTATANEHYHFVGWTVNGTPINTQETTYTVTVTPEMAGMTFYVEAVFAQNEGIDDNEGILEATIYAQEGQIVVEGAGNSTVVLYDVTGRRLAVKHSDNAPLRFDIAVSGTYLVKVGNAPAKRIVMVR